MWEGKDPDPGGTGNTAPTPQELSDLKDQNEQQLVLIAQLKEMLRKEQSSVSQDKVEEYVNTLTRARAKRSKQKKGDTSTSSTTSSGNIDANKKERMNLLRQQLEENKARLAERGKSQKGIEEMVTQLQAQLNDTHSLTPLNASLAESKNVDYHEGTPQKELYNILLTKEKKISELLSKSQKLEANVLDLQENLKEKDSVIEARTKAITLMTDSLSKKGKNTLDALEETKEQMRKMQENFVTLEAEMKARQMTLLNDLKLKNFEISELQQEKAELEQKLSDRAAESVDDKTNKLQLENQDLQTRFSELSKENVDKAAQISDLKDELVKIQKQMVVDLPQSDAIKEVNRTLLEEKSKHLLRIEELEQSLLQLQEIEDTKQQLDVKKLMENNDKLSKDNAEHLIKIQQLENQLEAALTDLKLLKNTGMGGATKSNKDENEEISKLKKQLDESNKSMIKMRAVQKGKIKELNKKLDQFRKMNDANAFIVQLQNENSKLSEKIAELEDEKGNLQLKMVDSSTSSKDDSTELEEEFKQLKEKLNKLEQELNEKEKVIEILESEVLSLKADLKKRDEEEIKVSTQVSSEMSSICYEEQIETLEVEKRKLTEQLQALDQEKSELMQELELVRKEKQDINTKLNSYIQENMELIDKLEKLSAEKVSSAESIEIVEGLTQQEKLELAAYQKHINPEETLKCTDEDSIEPPVELNESVLQLSEDTAELLQKIEMFTQERKEVMQKMEALKDENNTLCMKVKEIENNRDILEETYEHLQNEKDTLANENRELSNKLASLQASQTTEKDQDQSAQLLDATLKDLQIKYEALIQENDGLKRTLKEFDSMVQEKHDLENRLREMIENNSSLDTKLNSNLDEINTYQLTIEENKAELINSAETINKLHNQLEERENDIQELHINIDELNNVVSELQGKQGSFENMESELDQLKSSLTSQITQAGDYESELAQNSVTIQQLNEELMGVNRKILELENELELKDGEVEKLAKDINNKDAIIKKLQTNIEEKDSSFKMVSEDMKVKYLELKKQLDNNDGTLQAQIVELNNKNKEQLEKMKKIAANLKKKSQAYQDLEEQFKIAKEKWEIESKEKEEKVDLLTQALGSSEDRLRANIERLSLVETELSNLKDQMDALEQTNADQQHYIQELKHKQDKISLQQEMSASLHEEIDSSFPKSVPDDKIRELEVLLETNEGELNHYKERLDKLQIDLRILQESKLELETTNAELEEKLNLTSNSFKEKALLEDQLELKLAEVTANDEALARKLLDVQREYDEILKKNQEHEDLIKRLKIKLKKAHDKVTELKAVQGNLQELETANRELKAQVIALEDNQRHIQSENESLQKRNMSDYEKIEADYMVQLEELLKTKNELQADNEKAVERIKELEENLEGLTMEVNDYKEEIAQAKLFKNELDNSKIRLQEAVENSESVKKELDNQLRVYKERYGDMESFLKNQTEFSTPSDVLEHFKQLILEVDGLKKDISALEFANSSLEASCVSSQKLDFEPIEVAVASDFEQGKPSLVLKGFDQDESGLRQELAASNTALGVATQEIATLKSELAKLNEEIHALQFAKASLEASYESTQKPLVPPVLESQPQQQSAVIPLFNAFAQPEATSSEFDQWFKQPVEDLHVSVQNSEVEAPPAFSPVVEDGREALLKKIKALEFLLYNVDKEKEIALEQCLEMVNELTQIIYNQTQPSSENLESQILSSEAIAKASNKKSLQATEYAPTNVDYGEHQSPVEEVVGQKEAYLCYDKNEPMTTAVEAQIVSKKDIAEQKNKKELQQLEYQPVEKIIGEQKHPVVEPLAQSKQAYLCYTKDDKVQNLEENDDGWGWGPEEARLEEEHMSTVENTPQVKNLMMEVQQLKETIRVLQMERDNHLKEIKQLQVKSGKLIKKCKELKGKKQEGSTSFFDLNETIQEELKTQVQQLEKTLKELKAENEKEKAEKSNLLKRVDVLTAANDRMTEMKEIQDSEVFRWQRKHQEALQKLQEYEWGSDGFGEASTTTITKDNLPSTSTDNSSKIDELEATIKELSLDNEELQALLETERTKRLEAEKNKTAASEGELLELRSINQNLNEQLDKIKLESNKLQLEITQLISEKDQINQKKLEFEALVHDKEVALEELQKQVASNNDGLIIDELQNNLGQLTTRQRELDHTVVQLQQELQSALSQNSSINIEANELRLQIAESTKVIEEHELTIKNLNGTIETNQRELQMVEETINKMKAEKELINTEFTTIMQDLQTKTLELQQCQQVVSELQARIKEIELFGAHKTKQEEENQSLLKQLEEKQRLLEELQTKALSSKDLDELSDNIEAKSKEIEELRAQQLAKDTEIQRLLTEAQNKEQEFQDRINTLNEAWQLQVDQRGADVAESWKMHLEMVEKDFASIEEKFKLDMSELEEKCNLLVNENNELRKNVDQEIRNEVDKMSALQQQITGLQQTISALNGASQEKDKRIEEIQNNLANYLSLESELQTLKVQNAEKDTKLATIDIIIETTQKQFDEKREVVEAIVAILEKHALQPISYEKEDILREFQRQLSLGGNKDEEISRLNQLVKELEDTLNIISGEKSREITGLNQVIEDLGKDLTMVHEKESEIIKLKVEFEAVAKEKADLIAQLEQIKLEHANCRVLEKELVEKLNIISAEKSREVTGLNQVIEDLGKELSILRDSEFEIVKLKAEYDAVAKEKAYVTQKLDKLKLEHANCQVLIDSCNGQVQEYYNAQMSLQASVETKAKELDELNRQLLHLQTDAKNDSNLEVEKLSNQLENMKQNYQELQLSLSECQSSLQETKQQLAIQLQESQAANENILQYSQKYANCEQENIVLKDNLLQLEKDKNEIEATIQRHYGELLSNKEIDINTLKTQVQELINANEAFNERLNQELSTKQLLEQQLAEQTQLVNEDTKQLEELKLLIEDQVTKIEELKKELFNKSNQYDSLIAEMDVGRPPVTQQPLAAAVATSSTSTSDDDASEPVSRAELDLALYMWHQRDVRCEELTVEVTHLLEERDTLQLRLSNALREKEELRRNISANPTAGGSEPSKSSAIFLAASGTELAKEPLESEQNLATKLSELKNVGYKKDKTFVDEQETRRLQQLAIMQQHINDASKLPPEAAAKLVDASYTLSRDVQSPSKVLLNWLWGKNPPKANDS